MSDLTQFFKKRMEATREAANLRELAYVRRRPVYGRSTRSTSSRAVTSKSHHRQATSYQQNDNKSLDFVYYSDSEEEQEEPDEPGTSISCNFVDCIINRERGCDR